MAVNLSDDTVGRPQKDVFNAQARQCHWGQERVGVGEVGVGRGGGGSVGGMVGAKLFTPGGKE